MLAVALRFQAGRFHATPWGRHVNEGVAEWPPSPWRLLRALTAVWKRSAAHVPADRVRAVLEAMAAPPEFHLPPATVAHTRHYMPQGGPRKDAAKKTHTHASQTTDTSLVFDTFVAVDRGGEPAAAGHGGTGVALDRAADVVALWRNAGLRDGEAAVLDVLLSRLGYLGRAESWCEARRLADADLAVMLGGDEGWLNCRPKGDRPADGRWEPVRVLCPDPQTAFADTHTPKGERTVGRGRAKTVERRPVYDPDWNLCLETSRLHDERWSEVPGSRWVTYLRAADALRGAARGKRVPINDERPKAARFVLDANVLPLLRETLPLGDFARVAMMGRFRNAVERRLGIGLDRGDPRGRSPVFSGRDPTGSERLLHHGHAWYLPTDEDGDGRLDHLTLWAADGFGPDEVSALRDVRPLRFGEGEPLRLLLVGLGSREEVSCGLLKKARVWESVTPYVAGIHPKSRGPKRADLRSDGGRAAFLREAITHEIRRRDWRLSAVEVIWPSASGERSDARPWEFRRARRKAGDDGWSRPFGLLRLVFADAVDGPVAFGHGCHFGMGLFTPRE